MNLYPVQSGGGQQVAINFIQLIANNNYEHNWFFYVGEGSEIHHTLVKLFNDENILSLPYSYSNRFLNRRIVKKYVQNNQIDIIYNYAPTLPITGIPQVVRSVYSNLYYPKINFWSGYPLLTKFKKKLIDYLRLRGTLAADGLIFENQGMQKNATELYGYPQNKTIYIAPSVTKFDTKLSNHDYDYLATIKEFKILYLSSWHLNKNIHKLPDVALSLKKSNIPVKFILSLNPTDPQVKHSLLTKIQNNNVNDYFELIGKVKAQYVHQVLEHSDAIILLSKLECFSSNIIEAFTFKKPLIISDEEWSRAACKEAALFVERDDSESIAKAISNLANDRSFYSSCVEQGQKQLTQFNTPDNKIKQQIDFLENIHNNFYK